MPSPPSEKHFDDFQIAVDSLTLYGRSDVVDERSGSSLLSELYVDPLATGSVIQKMSANKSTLLVGRKGVGKSTIFQRLQYDLRTSQQTVCAYMDIRAVFANAENVLHPQAAIALEHRVQNAEYARQLIIAKSFIGLTIDNLVVELTKKDGGLYKRLRNALLGTDDQTIVKLQSMLDISRYVSSIDIGQVNDALKERGSDEQTGTADVQGMLLTLSRALSIRGVAISGDVQSAARTEKVVAKAVLFNEFNFRKFVDDLRALLAEVGVKRLFIIIDDFSELSASAMDLFVRHVLEPLNAIARDFIFFKIAVYPRRYNLGSTIDLNTFDVMHLDSYDLYGGTNATINATIMERRARDFIRRLLNKRVEHFTNLPALAFFSGNEEDVFDALYYTTYANPRMLGTVLNYSLINRKSPRERLTVPTIYRAAERSYNEKIAPFFWSGRIMDLQLNESLSVQALQALLQTVVKQARSLHSRNSSSLERSLRVSEGAVPSSHFRVSRRLETLFSTLEMNAFLTKYSERRVNGVEFTVYALNHGLCRSEGLKYATTRMPHFGDMLSEPMFDFTRLVDDFATSLNGLHCVNAACEYVAKPDEIDNIKRHNLRCPACGQLSMQQVRTVLQDSLDSEGSAILPDTLLLPDIDARILTALFVSGVALSARDLGIELDYPPMQLGVRAKDLVEKGLLVRPGRKQGRWQYNLTDVARSTYFSSTSILPLPARELPEAEE